MRKIGINFNTNTVLKAATGEILQSHINIYWNEEYSIGIDPTSEIVAALKLLDMRIPVNIVTSNEYITTDGPKIEIVLGADYKDFFTFSKPVEYLPKIEMPIASWTTVSWEKKTEKNQWTSVNKINTPQSTNTNSPYKVAPGEWEEL